MEQNLDFENKMDRKLATIQIIENIRPIPEADAIELCSVKGWDIVVKKGEFKEGEKCIYLEIDSIVPEKPEFEFLRRVNFRIKTIKLRGQISQGLCLPLSILSDKNNLELDSDVTEALGITKYIRPEKALPMQAKGSFPEFANKTDEERFQNLLGTLERNAGVKCAVFEKLDGSSMTMYSNKQKFGVCSRNLELKESDDKFWTQAKKNNWNIALNEYCITNNVNLAIQGELIGNGIQGNKYKLEGTDFYAFDVFDIDKQEYVNIEERRAILKALNIKEVPFVQYWDCIDDKEQLIAMSNRKSALNSQTIAEGIVIRSVNEMKGIRGTANGRFSFKVINPMFLLKNDE